MEGIQNFSKSYKLYPITDCSQHPATKNQSSNSDILQVDPKEVSLYTSEPELKGDQATDNTDIKQVGERRVANANCILCKTSTAEIIKVHDGDSTSKKVFAILKITAMSVTTTCLVAAIVALIPAILSTFVMLSLTIAGSLAAVSLFFGLATASFIGSEYLNNSHYLSYLRANLLINPMLNLIKNVAEQDEELKTLLSTGMNDQDIKNIADNITEQQYALIKQYKELCTQLINISNLNNKSETAEITDNTNLEIENKLIQDNLIEAEQQKIVIQDKFYLATKELLCSLINNICKSFATDNTTQEKIKSSLLEAFKHNPDDCTATFVNIVNKCLNINKGFSSIASDIKTAVKDAANNTFADLYT
jgi:hypothetical protein